MVSEVSTTINVITTTTITYFDGTTEVETSAASAQANQGGSQAGQTYHSQGALSINGASAAASGV